MKEYIEICEDHARYIALHFRCRRFLENCLASFRDSDGIRDVPVFHAHASERASECFAGKVLLCTADEVAGNPGSWITRRLIAIMQWEEMLCEKNGKGCAALAICVRILHHIFL